MLKRELAAVLRNPAFLVVFTVLVVAGLGFNTAARVLGLNFQKQPVELRQALTTIPERMGPWVQLNVDIPLTAEVEQALGTNLYINRNYVNLDLIGDPALVEAIRQVRADTPTDVRDHLTGQVLHRHREAFVQVHIPYYTGMVDTVAHVPERCMVGGGFDTVGSQRITLDLDLPDARRMSLPASLFNFRKRERSQEPMNNVIYFFSVNGQWEGNSGEVRAALQNLFQKHSYYAKVELRTVLNDDIEQAKATMTDFTTHLMPHLERCLPDWNAVVRGESGQLAQSR